MVDSTVALAKVRPHFANQACRQSLEIGCSQRVTPRLASRGFTLIELLIALVILALVSAISVPMYNSYAKRTYRTQAQADLLGCAQGLERFAAVNFTYQNSADTDGDGVGDSNAGPVAAEICEPRSQTDSRYTLSVTSTVSTYVLTATPNSGAVANDGFLTLDEAGARGWDCNNDGDTADAHETSWEEPSSECT